MYLLSANKLTKKKSYLRMYSIKTFKVFALGIVVLLIAQFSMAQELDFDVPIGWATVLGYGVESTTGGGNGNVVTATTVSELSDYAGSSSALVIMVEGTITGSTMVNVASNKTIIGKGANAKLIGVGLSLRDVSNVIIRNLSITGALDAIATRGSHHVWIDHCDVSNCGDGLIDITNQSNFHTVSWTRFSNHDKTMLINSGTSKPDDLNTLNTTVHHVWYNRSNQRNPRVGYGKVHLFNSLLSYNGSYGIGLHSQGRVLAEKNFFDHVPNPIKQMYRSDPNNIHHGFCESVDNIFDSCKGKQDDEGISFPVDQYYMYDFMLNSASDVPEIVKSNVGPDLKYEKLGLMPIPGMGAKNIGITPTLRWTKGALANSYIVYFGTTSNPPVVSTVSSRTYKTETLDRATMYYWRVDQVTATDTVKGKVWAFETLTGLPTVSIDSPNSKEIVTAGYDLNIRAKASDKDGSIVKVEFFQGVTSLGVDSVLPYSVTWPQITAGEYMLSVQATDNDGHTVTSPLVYIEAKTNTAVAAKKGEKKVKIYPVPANNLLKIDLGTKTSYVIDISIIDLIGKVVQKDKMYTKSQTFDISSLPKGIYVLKVSGGNLKELQKIIKQ